MIADGFTKALSKCEFYKFLKNIGIVQVTSNQEVHRSRTIQNILCDPKSMRCMVVRIVGCCDVIVHSHQINECCAQLFAEYCGVDYAGQDSRPRTNLDLGFHLVIALQNL